MKNMVRITTHQCFHWIAIPAIAVAMTLWPTFSSGLSELQYDAGDTLLNLYFLEHAYQHFSRFHILQPERYWSPEFFWPIKDTLAWSDHLLGPSLIYGLFRPFLDPYQSYVGWLSTTLMLNYTSLRLAARRISPQTLPFWSSLATLATAFSPVITQQLSHPQLLSLFIAGPILWQCHRLICLDPEDFHFSDWILLATWLLINGFFNIYIFVYGCYAALICSGIHLVRRWRSRSYDLKLGGKLAQRCSLFAACVSLNLMIYIPYLQTLETFGKRPTDEILRNLPKPASWLYGNDNWLIPPPWTPAHVNPDWIYGAEQECFPGWSACILLAASLLTAIWFRRNNQAVTRTWILVFVMMVVGTLSIHNISIWLLVSKLLPGATSLRASSRVVMMIVLFAMPTIVLAAQEWRPKEPQPWAPLTALLACTGTFVGIWHYNQPAFSLSAWKKEMNAISNAVVKSDCDVFWYEWHDQAPWRAQVIAMHAQQNSGVPTANGYSGQFPKPDWPFTKPSGDAAYFWITDSDPGRHHRLHPLSNKRGWCTVSVDNNGNAGTRKFNPFNKNQNTLARITKPGKIIFQNQDIVIINKYGNLYMKSNGMSSSGWIPLTRDGIAIPANRDNYAIKSARKDLTGKIPLIRISDQNPIEGIEYEWIINPQTGELMGQSMRDLPRHR
jgi:hypothetical protein